MQFFRTPDDGCKEHPKHVQKSGSEIKYRLINAASRWKLIYIIFLSGLLQASKYVKCFNSCYSSQSSTFELRTQSKQSAELGHLPFKYLK
jgi:hypothetical protein